MCYCGGFQLQGLCGVSPGDRHDRLNKLQNRTESLINFINFSGFTQFNTTLNAIRRLLDPVLSNVHVQVRQELHLRVL